MTIYQPEPCPPSGAGSGSVAEFILCDDGTGSKFIRKFFQDSAGAVTSVVDHDVDGSPYTVVGPVAVCASAGGGGGGTTDGLTNAQLRAAAVDVNGTVALDSITLAALETINAVVSGTVAISNFPGSTEISNDTGNPVPVSGTITLDSTTLAALETINAVLTGPVALDSATLAALENITAAVTGTVGLDAATLAALETINTVVSGTVSVDNFPTSLEISNDVGNPIPVLTDIGSARETTLGRRFAPNPVRVTQAVQVSAVGTTTVYTPAAGKKVRLHWVGLSSSQNSTGETLVRVLLGATVIYRWNMGNPGAFSHYEVIDGAVDNPLKVILSNAYPVEVNFTVEDV